jgi:hypothetical protein
MTTRMTSPGPTFGFCYVVAQSAISPLPLQFMLLMPLLLSPDQTGGNTSVTLS